MLMNQLLKAFLKGLDLVRTSKYVLYPKPPLSVNVKVWLTLCCILELLDTTVLVLPVSAKDCCIILIAMYREPRRTPPLVLSGGRPQSVPVGKESPVKQPVQFYPCTL